jgi:hypothetical protein
MKLLICLLILMIVVTAEKPKPGTKIWNWVDDNMPKEWRSTWREANKEYQKFDWEQKKDTTP